MRFTRISALILAAGFLVWAEPQETPEYTLAGTVTNSATGEPVKRALITLITYDLERLPPAAKREGRPLPKVKTFSTFTDASGIFRFAALPPGTYTCTAERPGFAPAVGAQRAPRTTVQLKASIENFAIALDPLGVITGKVVDEDGEPVRGVNVVAFTIRIDDGERIPQQARSVSTNDQGIYRLWNLRADKYYIKAAGRTGGTFLYAGDAVPRLATDEGFGPVYYGGGATLASAAPIDLAPGAEAQASLTVKMGPAHRIRGALANFVPGKTAQFELLNGDEDVATGSVALNEATGTFEIDNIVPGSFTLHVTQGATGAGDVAVNVSDSDVAGVVVPLNSAVDIHMTTRLTEAPKPADPDRQVRQSPGFCTAWLRQVRRLRAPYSSMLQEKSETAVIAGVLPGRYRVDIECNGAYVRSATWGTQDLLANPIVTISPDGQSPIEVQAVEGGGRVTGTVANASGGPGVLLVPQFDNSSGPRMMVAFSGGDDSGARQFRFFNLAPGAYVVYAFSNWNEVEYRNPDFLKSLSGGVSVRVDENGEQKITIAEVIR